MYHPELPDPDLVIRIRLSDEAQHFTFTVRQRVGDGSERAEQSVGIDCISVWANQRVFVSSWIDEDSNRNAIGEPGEERIHVTERSRDDRLHDRIVKNAGSVSRRWRVGPIEALDQRWKSNVEKDAGCLQTLRWMDILRFTSCADPIRRRPAFFPGPGV